jgi:hypothetical protein
MAAHKKPKNVTVEPSGVSAKVEIGRIAAKGFSRRGEKKRGKYEREALRGHEFSKTGHLMYKERIIDRKNNCYKELVVDADTGQVTRNVEQLLSEHTGHGYAKFKKKTT